MRGTRAMRIGTRLIAPFLISLLLCSPPAALAEEPVSKALPNVDLTPEERTWLKEHPTIRIGVDPDWPPIEFIGEDGAYSGMASDIVRLVGKRLGVHMEVAPGLTWSQVVDKVRKRKIDALACASRTGDRETYLLFTRPYLNIPVVILTRTDAPYIGGIRDLYGKTLAVIKSYQLHERLPKDHPQIKIHVMETAEEALEAVSEGTTFAFAGSLATTSYLIHKLGIDNLEVASPTQYSYVLSFAARKDWPELVGVINKALATITDRERTEISRKWISLGRYRGIDYALVLKGAGAAAGILILVLLWNFHIRRQREAIRKSEEELQRVMDSMPNPVFVTGADGRMRLVNREWESLTGKNRQEAVGQTYDELYQKDLAERYSRLDREVLSTLQPLSTEETTQTPRCDGTFVYNLAPLVNPVGEPYAVCGTMTDITRRKQAEVRLAEALAESNRLLAEAAHYVTALLPQPIAERGIQTDWRFIPSTQLGGDCFGYHWLDDRHFAMYLVDVCGHGVSAALLSVTIMNVLRSQTLQQTDFRKPGQVLSALNDAFPMEKQNGMYFTIWYGVCHTESRTLTYSSGGHPPALLLAGVAGSDHRLARLQTENLFIGGMPDIEFETQRLLLSDPSRLYLFSDGVFEIPTGDNKIWGFQEFEDFVRRSTGSKSSVMDQLMAQVLRLNQADALEDDFSILEIVIN